MQSVEALLAWFDRHQRQMPWRLDRDPYRIWVSEIMLQQTRVETVIPYFERFIARFPRVEDLAAAELPEVLALWSGLGYYRRGRQLHAAARIVAEQGELPSSVEGLLKLPGVGEYTAAAVASMGFGARVPVLDGNVERVLSRLLREAGDPKARLVRARLRAAGLALLAVDRPGDSNQALMELGATICLPRRPRCLLCPLEAGCEARRHGDAESFPRAKTKRAQVREYRRVVWAEDEGRLLLFRRPEDSELLAGIWELPWVELPRRELEQADRDEYNGAVAADEESRLAELALAARYGGEWKLGARLGEVRHGITFRDLRVQAVAGTVVWGGEVGEGLEAGWFLPAEREQLPQSSLLGKVSAAVSRARQGRTPAPGRPRADTSR